MRTLNHRVEIYEAEATNCPYLSTSVLTLQSSKSGFALIGGILTILSSLACVPLVLFYIFFGFVSNWGEYLNYPPDYWSLLIGILFILGFALGLAGGIMALIKRNFALAIIGPSLIVSEVLAIALYMRASGVFGVLLILLFAIPSLLGLICVAIAKQEFHLHEHSEIVPLSNITRYLTTNYPCCKSLNVVLCRKHT